LNKPRCESKSAAYRLIYDEAQRCSWGQQQAAEELEKRQPKNGDEQDLRRERLLRQHAGNDLPQVLRIVGLTLMPSAEAEVDSMTGNLAPDPIFAVIARWQKAKDAMSARVIRGEVKHWSLLLPDAPHDK
jgi:hypothetical protein